VKSKKTNRTNTFQKDVERIAEQLQNEIFSGIRMPTEHLTEAKLTEAYSVNRMTIRQVLNQLAAEGVVEIEPFKGATVAAVSIDQIVETYQVVGLLEGYAAGLATNNMTKNDIRELKGVLKKQRKIKEGDTKSWQPLDLVFHRIICKRCENQKVLKLLRQHIQFTRYWFLTLANTDFEASIKAHEQIIDAIEKKDGQRVREIMENHITNIIQRLVDHIKENVPMGMLRSG
jgi:DNA-binding GntR family transcriptional regulator